MMFEIDFAEGKSKSRGLCNSKRRINEISTTTTTFPGNENYGNSSAIKSDAIVARRRNRVSMSSMVSLAGTISIPATLTDLPSNANVDDDNDGDACEQFSRPFLKKRKEVESASPIKNSACLAPSSTLEISGPFSFVPSFNANINADANVKGENHVNYSAPTTQQQVN